MTYFFFILLMFSGMSYAEGYQQYTQAGATATGVGIAQGGDQTITFQGGQRPVPSVIPAYPATNAPTFWNQPKGMRQNAHAAQFFVVTQAACAQVARVSKGGGLLVPPALPVDDGALEDMDVEYDKTEVVFSPNPYGYNPGDEDDVPATVVLASLLQPKPFGDRKGRCLGTIVVEGLRGEDTAQYGTLQNDAVRFVREHFTGNRTLYLVSMPSVIGASFVTRNGGWSIGFSANSSGYMGDVLGAGSTGASIGTGYINQEGRPGNAYVVIEQAPEGAPYGVVIDFARIAEVYDTRGVRNVVRMSDTQTQPGTATQAVITGR